jgi:hypothetical protein
MVSPHCGEVCASLDRDTDEKTAPKEGLDQQASRPFSKKGSEPLYQLAGA